MKNATNISLFAYPKHSLTCPFQHPLFESCPMKQFLLNLFPNPKYVNVFLALAGFSLLCMAMLGYRMIHEDSRLFAFLTWNLFLAWIPFFTGMMIEKWVDKSVKGWVLFILLGGFWLIFFPNSAYILTDLLHLKPRATMPLWFDMIMLLSFAINGLFLGLISMEMIHRAAERLLQKPLAWVFITLVIGLSSFGIYVGRFLRWNSWDLFTRTSLVISDFTDRFFHPFEHGRTWGMTLLLGGLFFFAYLVFRFSQHREAIETSS